MIPDCPTCKGTAFIGIPDSLAYACKGCGFVWVGDHNDWKPGATLQEWAKDHYELAVTRDARKEQITQDQAIFLKELDRRPPGPTAELLQAGAELAEYRRQHPDSKW